MTAKELLQQFIRSWFLPTKASLNDIKARHELEAAVFSELDAGLASLLRHRARLLQDIIDNGNCISTHLRNREG